MRRFRLLIIIFSVMGAFLSFYALCFTPFLVTSKYTVRNSDVVPKVVDTYSFIVKLPSKIPLGDNYRFPNISTITSFTENGNSLSPHSPHDDIKNKGKGLYSHWSKHLIFSSSDNSDPRTNGKTYEITYKTISGMTKFLLSIFLISSLSLTLVFRKTIFPALILAVPVFIGVLALLFAVSALWAWTQGITPALTGMFKLLPDYVLFTGSERFLFMVIILWGVFGLICSYIANGYIIDKMLQKMPLFIKSAHSRFKNSFKNSEEVLIKYLRIYGLVLILFLTFFSLANFWAAKNEESSLVNKDDYARTSFAGFIPYSDACGYLFGSYYIADTGTQSSFNQRRPLNASFYCGRMLITDFDFILSMILQALLAGIGIYFAAAAIAECFGIWSSGIYTSLALAYLNQYLGLTLSETLGFSLGAIAAGFIVLAHYRNSYICGLWGILAFCFAQNARMGTLFVIPALAIWFMFKFYISNKKQYCLKIALLLIVLFTGCGISKLLNIIYGDGTNGVGSNFSLVICGLSMGKSWSVVYDIYETDLQNKTEKEQANILYYKAYDNFKKNPTVFFKFISDVELSFLGSLPNYYNSILRFRIPTLSSPDLFPKLVIVFTNIRLFFINHLEIYLNYLGIYLFWMAIIMGLFVGFLSDKKGFLALWGLSLTGFLASIALIFSDGEWRVLASGCPLFLVFLVSGLRSVPISTDKEPLKLTCRCITIITGLVIISSLFCPYIAYKSRIINSNPTLMAKPPQNVEEVEFSIPNLKKLPVIAVCNENEKRIPGVPNITPQFFESCYKGSYMANKSFKFDYKEPFLFFVGYDFYSHYVYYIFSPVSLISNKEDRFKVNCVKYGIVPGDFYCVTGSEFMSPLVKK